MNWPAVDIALGDLPWAVVGAVATRLYMPERVTQDLDVLIAATDAAVAAQRLTESGYVRVGDPTIGGASWRSPDGRVVDVLECDAPWCREALTAATANRDAQGLPILPLAPLILMKLHAGRARDIGDLAQMLGQASPKNLEQIRTLVRRYAPADLEDLESLITLGRMEQAQERPPESDQPR